MNHDVRTYIFASDMLCDIWWVSIITTLVTTSLILLAFLCALQISQSYNVDVKKSHSPLHLPTHQTFIDACFVPGIMLSTEDTELKDAWSSRRLIEKIGLQTNNYISRYQLQ